MENDYECPKCHNIFPSQNKITHDLRCTEENPMALHQRHQMQINNQINKNQDLNNANKIKKDEENFPEISNQNQNSQINSEFQQLQQLSESDYFICDICAESLPESVMNDHMYCHYLEQEDKNNLNNNNILKVNKKQIEKQQKIEELIKKNNEMKRIEQQKKIEKQKKLIVIKQQKQIEEQIKKQNQMKIIEQQKKREKQIKIQNAIKQQKQIEQQIKRENDMRRQIELQRQRQIQIQLQRQRQIQIQLQRQIQRQNNLNRNNLINAFFQPVIPNYENPTDQTIINDLPENVIDDVTKLDNEKKNCLICLEDFKNGDKTTILPCIHFFHTNCILHWLKSQNSCPICKYKLIRNNVNQYV